MPYVTQKKREPNWNQAKIIILETERTKKGKHFLSGYLISCILGMYKDVEI